MFLLTLLLVVVAQAQIRGNNINVTVTPDHYDWNYKTGETAKFNVSVLRSGTPIANAKVVYEAGPEMYSTVKKELTLKGGTATLEGKMNKPGFYRVTVTYA